MVIILAAAFDPAFAHRAGLVIEVKPLVPDQLPALEDLPFGIDIVPFLIDLLPSEDQGAGLGEVIGLPVDLLRACSSAASTSSNPGGRRFSFCCIRFCLSLSSSILPSRSLTAFSSSSVFPFQ